MNKITLTVEIDMDYWREHFIKALAFTNAVNNEDEPITSKEQLLEALPKDCVSELYAKIAAIGRQTKTWDVEYNPVDVVLDIEAATTLYNEWFPEPKE